MDRLGRKLCLAGAVANGVALVWGSMVASGGADDDLAGPWVAAEAVLQTGWLFLAGVLSIVAGAFFGVINALSGQVDHR